MTAVRVSRFAHHLHRRQSAKRVQLVEGAMAALDHPWNDIVAPVTDVELERHENCVAASTAPLPNRQVEDFATGAFGHVHGSS